MTEIVEEEEEPATCACDWCGDDVPESATESLNNGDTIICMPCYDYSVTCDDCGYTYSNDSRCVSYHARRNAYYCEDCYVHDDDSDREDYGAALHTDDKGCFEGLRMTGLEIEAEHGDKYDLMEALMPGVAVVYDGSVSDGWEMVSPPAQGERLQAVIENMCQSARSAGFQPTSSCGVHVHLGDVQGENLAKLLNTFTVFEDAITSMMPKTRRTNSYCKPMKGDKVRALLDPEASASDVELFWYGVNNANAGKYHDSRYFGMNIHSWFFRRTVEFRHHSATLNATKIKHWVRILHALVDYAENRYDHDTIWDTLMKPRPLPELIARFAGVVELPGPTYEYLMRRAELFNPDVNFGMSAWERRNSGRELTEDDMADVADPEEPLTH